MDIQIKHQGQDLLVHFPYDEIAKTRIKEHFNGRWNPTETAWAVDAAFEDEVRELLNERFGTDGTRPIAYQTLRVTALKTVSEYHGPVTCCGKVLARAHGRDSGAKTGSDVVLLSGGIHSGGSRKNWKSIVEEGSVFKLVRVLPALVEEDPDWKIELIEEQLEEPSDEPENRPLAKDLSIHSIQGEIKLVTSGYQDRYPMVFNVTATLELPDGKISLYAQDVSGICDAVRVLTGSDALVRSVREIKPRFYMAVRKPAPGGNGIIRMRVDTTTGRIQAGVDYVVREQWEAMSDYGRDSVSKVAAELSTDEWWAIKYALDQIEALRTGGQLQALPIDYSRIDALLDGETVS